MSTEERMPAEERAGNKGEPEHQPVVTNRPRDSDADPRLDRAEDNDEAGEEDEKTTREPTT